jgi:hypothetical protein
MYKHFKYKVIPANLKEKVYIEGKEAFRVGTRRGHNPYAANNLALATIWWHGWDTGNEQNNTPIEPDGTKSKKI